MNFSKGARKIIASILIILVLCLVIFLVVKQTTKNPSSTSKSGTKGSSVVNKSPSIETDSYKYQKPLGWEQLKADVLTAMDAESGIGRPPGLLALFTVKQSPSVPANAADQKSGTLSELKKLPNFVLISSGDTTVNGTPGQKFIYTHGDSKAKDKRELIVVVHNKKTYFLLLASSEKGFESQAKDFNSILSSFAFK